MKRLAGSDAGHVQDHDNNKEKKAARPSVNAYYGRSILHHPAIRRSSWRTKTTLLAVAAAVFVVWSCWQRLPSAVTRSPEGLPYYVADEIALRVIGPTEARYNWAFLRAVLEHPHAQERPAEVEILAFAPSELHNRAQVFSESLEDIITGVACVYNSSADASTSTTTEIQVPARRVMGAELPRALLYRCPVPHTIYHHLLKARPTTLQLTIRYDLSEYAIFEHHIPLQLVSQSIVSEQPPTRALRPQKSSLGICISPIFGTLDPLKLLEWRLHHAKLGFDVVYWYDRAEASFSSTKRLVEGWNEHLGIRDVWRHAPKLQPHNTTFVEELHSDGAYVDQIAYYMDCLSQARSPDGPSWLSLSDIDEWYMAAPRRKEDSSTSTSEISSSRQDVISSFLNSHEPEVASVCMQRIDVRQQSPLEQRLSDDSPTPKSAPASNLEHGDSKSSTSSMPLLLRLSSQKMSTAAGRRWNSKCFHRPTEVESVFIHWPETYRHNVEEDTASPETLLAKVEWYSGYQPGAPQLLHAREKELNWPAFEDSFELSTPTLAWLKDTWLERDRIARLLGIDR